MARNLLDRPPDEPLAESLVAAIVALYGSPQQDGMRAQWLRGFRTLVATEPSLHGEYLKSSAAAEDALAVAIARRMQVVGEELRPRVLAAIVVGAERAAVRHWIEQKDHNVPLVELVRAAVQTGVSGIEDQP
jgi:MftR C-terminal domain